MVLQPIHDIAEICAKLGVREAVLSPGSRCAPLTISFVRHPKISTWTISDERSAAFIALGMAQKTGRPVVIVCTSGTATLNYGPAVAEAFFQKIPMVVLTADRPPEWIDQQDGQTVRQTGMYGSHVKASFSLPDQYSLPDVRWSIYRIMNEAVNRTMGGTPGPVHVNVPLREPFYPSEGETLDYSRNIKVNLEEKSIQHLSNERWDALRHDLKGFRKVLVLGGQSTPDLQVQTHLNTWAQKVPVVGDVISNLHSVKRVITHPDIFLQNISPELVEKLKPELLITFANSIVSKNLKLFLRENPPKEQWHIQEEGPVADTFKSITRTIRLAPETFFAECADELDHLEPDFASEWTAIESEARKMYDNFCAEAPFGELMFTRVLLQQLEASDVSCSLHLANSMPVRLANFAGLSSPGIKVYSNRGTSGIDGTNSTALGHALMSDETTFLLTGDMAFFYDRNAFWHNYETDNLKIILLNNQSGGIFGMIDGPVGLPEAAEYFETHQRLDATHVAREFNFSYVRCESEQELDVSISALINSKRKTILEVATDNEINKKAYRLFKQEIINTFHLVRS